MKRHAIGRVGLYDRDNVMGDLIEDINKFEKMFFGVTSRVSYKDYKGLALMKEKDKDFNLVLFSYFRHKLKTGREPVLEDLVKHYLMYSFLAEAYRKFIDEEFQLKYGLEFWVYKVGDEVDQLMRKVNKEGLIGVDFVKKQVIRVENRRYIYENIEGNI
jgi:hypothetical protein